MKTFSKDTAGKFQKALVIAVTVMALGGAQQARAQGGLVKIIDKVSQTVGNFNQKTGHLLSSIENAEHQVDIAKYHNQCLEKRTGNIVSRAAGVVTGLIVKNKAEKEVKRQQESAGYVQTGEQGTSDKEELAMLRARVAQLEGQRSGAETQETVRTAAQTRTTTQGSVQTTKKDKEQRVAELYAQMKSKGYIE